MGQAGSKGWSLLCGAVWPQASHSPSLSLSDYYYYYYYYFSVELTYNGVYHGGFVGGLSEMNGDRVEGWTSGRRDDCVPKKVGSFNQTSASQSQNGTSRDLVFQEPLVSLPKAHLFFGGCGA